MFEPSRSQESASVALFSTVLLDVFVVPLHLHMRTTQMTGKRRYIGEEKAEDLVKWLNEPKNAAEWRDWRVRRVSASSVEEYQKSVKRVAEILDGIHELYRLAELANWNHDFPLDRSFWTKYRSLGEKINKSLRRYRPHMGISLNDVYRDGGVWRPESGKPFRFMKFLSVRSTPIDEWAAILRIEEGYEGDWLRRVRRCAVCRQWFFARNMDGRHCSRRCRNKERQSKPEYRNWRHKYYLNHEKQRRVRRLSLSRTRKNQAGKNGRHR
jgi:hypothetical protein